MMDIQIKSRNIEVSDQLRTWIEKKVSKLERFLPEIDEARVELGGTIASRRASLPAKWW